MATSNLLIVGDSFVAEGENKHDWAWWNRLANDLNCNTINLGIMGASNFNIWHQLKEGLKVKPDKVLVVLTAPNRIESLENSLEDKELSYYDFLYGNVKSWSAADRLAQKEISVDYAEKFCEYNIAVSKDQIIADSILGMLKNIDKSVILPNLFDRYEKNKSSKTLYSVIPRNYCDVVSGNLQEEETGHIYKSWHNKFYTEHGNHILEKLR
jgi:hypothetical protein